MPGVKINKERCKACGYCILVCPKDVLGISADMNMRGCRPADAVNPDKCTGCTLCAVMCPDVCIEVWK